MKQICCIFFQGANVCFEENDAVFGLIKLGDSAEKEITLCNKSPIAANWTLHCQENKVIRT